MVWGGVWDASDEAILSGYATGDPDAAAVFVERFQSRAFGVALMITTDRAEAEEVAQEAFVRAWRYAASYDARRGSVATWLLRIVRNVALDRVQLASRRRESSLDDLPPGLADDEVPDLADGAVERDAAARVVASMASLPAEQREALLAVTVLGLTTSEVSAAAGVPLGTVKTRIRLGLRKLRDQLGVAV